VLVDVVEVLPIPDVRILPDVCAAAIGAAINVAAAAADTREICLKRCICESPFVANYQLVNQPVVII
jgi:hypothetical protein